VAGVARISADMGGLAGEVADASASLICAARPSSDSICCAIRLWRRP